MRVSRIYTPSILNLGQRLELDEETSHYVKNVLRLKSSQKIVLFNNQGGEYAGHILELARKTVWIQIEEFIDRSVESGLIIRLGIGISRGDRMDWAVQKAVELGVNQITPLITERCVIKFNDEKKSQRLTHWKNIIQHAAEQSGRTHLPLLSEIEALPNWVNQQQDLKVFLDPYAEQSLSELKLVNNAVCLLSGPEGGFASNERQTALAGGFIPVRLGARILRTETAVLSALAAVQTLWGDFN